MPDNTARFYHYAGAIHVHTTESDGTKSLEGVVADAQAAGLDFVLFADHMTLSNREAGKEGWYGRTLALIGYEHNDAEDNNHYLIFQSPRVYPRNLKASQCVDAAAADNALGIIAHPDEMRDRQGRYPPYPWTDWSSDRFDGLELWNQMSEWMERLTPKNQFLMALSPRKSMLAPPPATLRRWDEINLRRRCVGVVSVDAHAFPVTFWPLTVRIFPYKVHFRSLLTYLVLREPLARDAKAAAGQVCDALRGCHVYGANVRWGDARDFRFEATLGDRRHVAGEEVRYEAGLSLYVTTPRPGQIRVFRNGEQTLAKTDQQISIPVDRPGMYRIEVWRNGRGWIFSNHMRIVP